MNTNLEAILEKAKEIENNTNIIYEKGRLSVVSNVDCLKGQASDTIVSIKDVSPIEHNIVVQAFMDASIGDVKMKVLGKNLIDWNDASKWVMDWGAKNKRGYLLPIVQGQQICVTFGANDSNDVPQYFYLSSCDAEGKVNGLCTFTGDKTSVFYKKYSFTPQLGFSYYLYPGA